MFTIPVAERSTARVWNRSLPGWDWEFESLAGGIVASCECCVLRYTSLWWADPSSRRVLPTVVCDLETSKIIVWRYRCNKSCHPTSYKHFSEHITSPSYNSQLPGCWNINGTSETHPITCKVTECKSVMSHPTSSVHFNVDECSIDLLGTGVLTHIGDKILKLNALAYYIFLWVCVCAWGGGMRSTGTIVCVRACSLNYPACNVPSHCFLRPLRLHHIFRHYLINGTIFGRNLLNVKCVFILSTTLIWKKNSHSKKNSARYCHKCGYVFM
jgi:hypothetical protein